MRLAFYAPMKSPEHPVPSGDRTFARGLVAALRGGGAEVDLASQFSCREGKGEAARQNHIITAARTEIEQAIATGEARGWQVWISYHNYYKAPDLLGPEVSTALQIPYVQIESTRARKRLGGPWDSFAQKAEAAADRADLIFHVTARDGEALAAYGPPGQLLRPLAPFLVRRDVQPEPSSGQRILSVGMMRQGDKLASYRLIAETMELMPNRDWQLDLAGDGPARAEIEDLMWPFGGRVRFLGALSHEALLRAYRDAAILFWPGVNEAFGMAYLEAQAEGLAILAQDRPGVRDVLPEGPAPAPEEGAPALARHLDRMLTEPDYLRARQSAALRNVAERHLLPRATATLMAGLAEIGLRPC
ncbi:MAG: glycosyltransferase family 4 protein [Sulfitobacter sp.]|nr:glycosyltransferase family 4 protein [Sulfitobacter sp.]